VFFSTICDSGFCFFGGRGGTVSSTFFSCGKFFFGSGGLARLNAEFEASVYCGKNSVAEISVIGGGAGGLPKGPFSWFITGGNVKCDSLEVKGIGGGRLKENSMLEIAKWDFSRFSLFVLWLCDVAVREEVGAYSEVKAWLILPGISSTSPVQ